MTQTAWTRNGQPVDATAFEQTEWEAMKQRYAVGDFVMPCCASPAIPKTSINGNQFFAHLSDECSTAPETVWHKEGKAAVLSSLSRMGIGGREEVPGKSTRGEKWEADVLFSVPGRTIAIELQRSYQHLRDFNARQQRYAESGVECYWLVRDETFRTLSKATARLVLARDFGGKFPEQGIGTGMLPELPVAMLIGEPKLVQFGLGKHASVQQWLEGILSGKYQHRNGSWNLG